MSQTHDTCKRANNGFLVCTVDDVRTLQDEWDAGVVSKLPVEYRESERERRAASREYNVKALCPRYGIRYTKPAK